MNKNERKIMMINDEYKNLYVNEIIWRNLNDEISRSTKFCIFGERKGNKKSNIDGWNGIRSSRENLSFVYVVLKTDFLRSLELKKQKLENERSKRDNQSLPGVCIYILHRKKKN